MTVGRICQREVDTAEPGESVQSAAQRMAARGVGTLIVLDAKQRPIGLVTDRDLALRVVGGGKDPYETRVADVMTQQVTTVLERAPIEDALALMRSKTVRRLPVVRASGELVGVLSLDDILSLLAEELGQIGRFLDETAPSRLATT